MSKSDYLKLRDRWYRLAYVLAMSVIICGLLIIVLRSTPFKLVTAIPGVALFLVLPYWIYVTVKYQREKYRQGYRIGPTQDVKRKPRP